MLLREGGCGFVGQEALGSCGGGGDDDVDVLMVVVGGNLGECA